MPIRLCEFVFTGEYNTFSITTRAEGRMIMNILNILVKLGKILNKKQILRIVVIAVMMIVGAFLETLGVSMIVPLVLVVTQPGIMNTNPIIKSLCLTLNINSEKTLLLLVIISLVIIFVVKGVFLLVEYYIQNRFVYNNRMNTQKQLLRTYLYKPYEFYLNINSSEILQNVNENVNAAFFILNQILGFFTEMVVTMFLIITIFIIDPLMTVLMCLVLLGLGLFLSVVIKPILKKEGNKKQKYGKQMSKWLLQSIHGLKEVKISRREEYFLKNFESNGRQYINAERKNAVLSAVPRVLIESLSVSAMLSSIAIMIAMGNDVNMMIPSLSAFAMAAVRLMPSANRMLTYINGISYYEPALDKLVDSLEDIKNKKTKTYTLQNNTRNLSLKKEISLQGVKYHYPNSNKNVIDNADMIIPIGTSVGIVGTSGAGKTTVVDILLGLLSPQEGKILSDGVDVGTCYQEWLSHIGYIPQMIFMLDDSIRNNVAFGLMENEIDNDKVWKALEDAQLADFIHDLPEGINTEIGEMGIRLSGGQRQRIGIARALYSDPDLLIFDEATSALDNETESAIIESINNLRGKKSMVIIAHRLQTIEGCDIVYRIDNGIVKREK